MADNTNQVGEPDRSRVSGSEDYEVRYVAEKHHISEEHVRELIRKHGSNRAELERAVSGIRAH